MLETISLQNFKGFKQLDNLKIKPITILCGTNSCGKSSILQSILLLKQTLESQTPNQILLLNGRLVRLGSFEDIIYEHNVENRLVFELNFRLSKKDKLSIVINDIKSLFWWFGKHEIINNTDILIDIKVILKLLPTTANKGHIKTITVEKLLVNFNSVLEGSITPVSSIEITLSNNDLYSIKLKSSEIIIGTTEDKNIELSDVKIIFNNLFSANPYINTNVSEANNYETNYIKFSLFNIYRLSNVLQTIFSSYSYLGPLREEPARRYIYEDEITQVGIKGENAAYLYLIDKDKVISNHYFYDKTSDSFKRKRNMTLSEAVQNWLDLMNIKGFKSEIKNDIVYLELNSNSATKTRVSIADAGFGVSQIFPIILEGLRMPRHNILMLEQPEIHLHPNLQMQLADYFVALAKSDKKVMVETHSDHIINRLVRRIVEDESNTLKNLIGIYFITATDSGAIYEEISIDENTGIINWPKDFFDQTASEQVNIIRAGLKKRQSARNKS